MARIPLLLVILLFSWEKAMATLNLSYSDPCQILSTSNFLKSILESSVHEKKA